VEATITNGKHGYRSGGHGALTKFKVAWSGEFGKGSVGSTQEVTI